ncbi:lysophospholipid acyltransferase family protein [Atopomonas sediminilitoris]|uniref:lysophospholipid acyltransferase family protein n=1 Tax=Atopomonas sediminilitoris TaxID=2919919 RepID=UPI001F4EEABB|nr:1-acylglycerol-3-phosphate O-acyltransferase [Atopomonas sediminilitoris]MCJ8170176.1 1-acylglycerol-3-phosphate O-acyltransferase [Atopomonas sediminilitoris]
MLFWLRMLLLSAHFVLTSIIGLLIGLIRPFEPDNSRLCARLYSWGGRIILGLEIRTEVEALKQRRSPCVYVSNHQSNYDLFVMGTVVPYRTVSIGKDSLKYVPFFGQLFWLAGNVLIKRGHATQAKQAMLASTEALKEKDTSIWVFAEGTRNGGNNMLPFKKGAFQMAIAAGVPIIPICSSSYPKHMQLKKLKAGLIKIRALAEIPTKGLTLDDVPRLMQECFEQMQKTIAQLDRDVLAAR